MQEETSDLHELLDDSIFIDFFNVFLSLPVFSQKLLFKKTLKEFEFDPPLRKSKQILDKSKLVKWLQVERLPLFMSTDIYREYILCKELLNAKLYYTESSHFLDYEPHKLKGDCEFAHQVIGNAVGMSQFRHYLKGTPGEKLLSFWMDAEKFKAMPNSEIFEKWILFRDIQTKYFKGKNIGTIDVLKDDADIIYSNEWSGRYSNNKNDSSIKYTDIQKEDILKIMNATDYTEIQKLLVLILKGYWLQRFYLHAKSAQEKHEEKMKDSKSAVNVISQSDIAMLKDIKEIDKALKLLQADSKPTPHVSKRKASFNWKAMFPENTVDGSFLNQEGDIVTLHKNGTVSVDAIDSTLDAIIEQYLSTSSSNDSGEEEFIYNQMDINTMIVGTDERSKSSAKIQGNGTEAEIAPRESEVHTSAGNKYSMDRLKNSNNEKHQVKRQRDKEKLTAKKRKNINEEETTVISDAAAKNSDVNSHLFDQLLLLDLSDIGSGDITNLENSGKSLSTFKSDKNIVKLPSLTNRSCSGILNSNNILPPIEEQQLVFPDAQKVIPIPGNSVVEMEIPEFKYKNTSEGYFRYDYQIFTLSIASNILAGNPFKKFLKRQKSHKRLLYLQFWNDVQCYLTTDKNDTALKSRRGHLLRVRYLLHRNSCQMLPKQLSSQVLELIPSGKADDLLRDAQDHVCDSLRGMFALYCRKDKKKFTEACIIRKSFHRKQLSSLADNKQPVYDHFSVTPDSWNVENLSDISQEDDYDQKKRETDQEKRMLKAVQIALELSSQFEEGLPIDKINVEDRDWIVDNEYGSLFVEKFKLVHRRDLIEYRERLRSIAKQKRAKLELEKLRLSEKRKTDIHTDDTPFYMKPFKKAGVWFQRPSIRPRSFQDVMKDPVHREFFRRFLIYHNAEMPMNFCNAIEDLKSCQDPRAKQNRVGVITKKYFSSVQTAIEMLNTDVDIIQAIPSQDKVTMAMLISAQSWVARALNENWFEKYQVTFPDEVATNLVTGIVQHMTETGIRQKGKDRSRRLWLNFASNVIQFRNDILNPNSAHLFELYLKGEIKKEVEKQKSSGQGYAHGMAIKKVIRNKLVDITKLVNDMHFVAEADRYRTMCDDARSNADSGAYCHETEKLIESKAKMLIDCFIDSDIPPRTQVNLTADQVDCIIQTFKSGMLDRSLFHMAMINIFPVVAFLWKRFQRSMFVDLYERWLAKHFHTEPEVKTPEVKSKKSVPDYRNITMSQIPTKRVVPAKGEEDMCKMNFSLSNGISMIVPINIAPTHFGFSALASSKDGASILGSSSQLEMQLGHRHKRHAVASSKASIGSSHVHMRPSSQGGKILMISRHNSQGGSKILHSRHSTLSPQVPNQITEDHHKAEVLVIGGGGGSASGTGIRGGGGVRLPGITDHL